MIRLNGKTENNCIDLFFLKKNKENNSITINKYNFKNLFLHHIRILFCYLKMILFLLFELIMPKDSNLIIFAGSNGQRYGDNSRYLFEYFLTNTKFHCYWLTNNEDVYISQKEYISNSILFGRSFYSLFLFIRAKYVIIDSGRGDVLPYYLSNIKKTVIQLWHGIPIKRVGFLDSKEDHVEYLKETKNYNYLICSSEKEKKILSDSFHLPYTSIWLTGYPRNDVLNKENHEMKKEHPYLNKKIILYAPTWRDNISRVKFFPFPDNNFIELNNFLEQHDAYILLRCHRAEYNLLSSIFSDNFEIFDRIRLADQDLFPDVNDLLPFVDILVSDYSGIIIDFLLLNRPMIFIPYDYEEYNNYRGFSFDYFSHTPGPKVYTMHDFLINIERYLIDPTYDFDERKKMRNIFHAYQDYCSCQRIANKILELT